MKEIPTIRLNTKAEIPFIGFGTWQLEYGKEAKSSVLAALNAGYRLIDTAKIYANERSVGDAIRESDIAREEIFITTKLWTSDFGYDQAMRAFDESLSRLGLEYIDLYLIHWPNGSARLDSWKALIEINKQGRAKAVGVSNFMVEHLKELFEKSGLVPAVNQIELHPFNFEEQEPVLKLCKAQGIVIEAYSPLARARQMNHEVISSIAEKHNKTTAQIMIKWAIQHETIPIPKSAHPDRIRSNLEVFDFRLTDEDMATLDNLS